MGFTLAQQTQQFLGALVLGAMLGMGYDLFRASRRVFHLSAAMVFGEDLCFFAAAGAVLLKYLMDRCWGEVRGFVILGIALGFFLYDLTVGPLVLKVICGVVRGMIRMAAFLLIPFLKMGKYAEKCMMKFKKIFLNALVRGKSFLHLQTAMLYNEKDHKIKGKGAMRHGPENL